MKLALSILASAALLTSLVACGGEAGTTAPGGSSAASAKASSKPAAKASAAPAATEAPKAAAVSFPAQPLPAPFETLTLGAPTGAKLETGVTKAYAMIEGPDYAFKIEEAKENTVPKLKEMLGKGETKFLVDQPEGIVADMPQKDGSSGLTVFRYLKIGEKGYKCSTTMKGAPKTPEKAQEAYDVCGTLKAK